MTPRIAYFFAAGLTVIAAGAYLFQTDESDRIASQPVAPIATLAQPTRRADPLESLKPPQTEPIAVPGETSVPAAPDEGNADRFEVDSSGQLVLNERTRLHIESLVALTDAAQLDSKTEDEVKDLPGGAAARAYDLVEKYRVYMIAQRQAYPPGVPPVDVDDMLSQQDGLHALRVAHFGQETADAFYGAEERLNRELLELMRLEKDKGLSLEEKADRAQALLDKQRREAASKKSG